jgi:hypothetical protein
MKEFPEPVQDHMGYALTGRETPKSDMELIEVRLKDAERIAKNAKEIRS